MSLESWDLDKLLALLGTQLEVEGSPDPARGRTGLTQAAVLVPLIEGAAGFELLYMRRADELPDHSGQVSFPGGIREEEDADLFATALRESVEEVGVNPSAVLRIGALSPVTTLEKYIIQPYISLWPDTGYDSVSPREVVRVFRVPLAWLLDTGSECETEVHVGKRRLIVPAWIHEGEVIWGATRRITLDLLRRLRRVL